MVLNYIWIGFILIAFIIATVELLMGNTEVFPAIIDSTFASSKTAFEISLGLTGTLALWMGIMKIGEKGGLVNPSRARSILYLSACSQTFPKGIPSSDTSS